MKKYVKQFFYSFIETSFAEFRCCSRHGKISTFRRTKTGLAREIRRRYAVVLQICRTGVSDTVKCRNSILTVFAGAPEAIRHETLV